MTCPPAEVLAADANLTALAKQLKAAGAGGTLDGLRATIYLALLTGTPATALLPTHPSNSNRTTTGGTANAPDGRPDVGRPRQPRRRPGWQLAGDRCGAGDEPGVAAAASRVTARRRACPASTAPLALAYRRVASWGWAGPVSRGG